MQYVSIILGEEGEPLQWSEQHIVNGDSFGIDELYLSKMETEENEEEAFF